MKYLLFYACLLGWAPQITIAAADMLAAEADISIAGAVTHQVVRNYLILELGDKRTGESSIKVVDLRDNREVLVIPGPYSCYNVSYGERPAIVVSRTIDEGTSSVRVFDLSGPHLFSKDYEQGPLLPSPNGTYFFTSNDLEIGVIPRVFDRRGHEVYVVRNVRGGGWDVNSLTDSLLLLLSDKIYVYDVFSGNCVRQIDYPRGLKPDFWISKVSSDGGKLIAFTPNAVVLVDTTLTVAWSHIFDNTYVINAAVSQPADFALLYLREVSDRSGYIVQLLNYVTAETLWRSNLVTNNGEGCSYFPNMLIDSSYALVKKPQIDYYLTGKLSTSTKSVLYNIAPNTGRLVSSEVIDGIVDVVRMPGNRVYLLRRDMNNSSTLTVGHANVGVER